MTFVLQTLSLVCVRTFFVASQSLKLPTTATDFAARSIYVNGAAYAVAVAATLVTGTGRTNSSSFGEAVATDEFGFVRRTLMVMIATSPAATASLASVDT